MSTSKNEGKDIKKRLLQDADKLGAVSRFGYFSVPYPATIGEGSYETEKKIKRDDKGKVILHPRNMIISPPKLGKGCDVLFSNPYKVDETLIKKLKESKLSDAKISKLSQNETKSKVKPFYPSGPKSLTLLYSSNKHVNNKVDLNGTTKGKSNSVSIKR